MRVLLVIAVLCIGHRVSGKIYVVSAFCHCAICCGIAGQPTASGKMPKRYQTIAAPRAIPFGTKMNIEGVGVRVVEDRAALRYDDRIDIFMGSDTNAHQRAKNFGIRKVNVEIVK